MDQTSTVISFSLPVSSGVGTVHLLGSWDNYSSHLPLSKDKTSSKPGSWKGTFRFPGTILEAGRRYWYYYIIDGYQASHNPNKPSTVEPTTGRELNVLDVPKSSNSLSSSPKSSPGHKASNPSLRGAVDIPKGRPLCTSQIESPKPINPSATSKIVEFKEDELSRFAATDIYNTCFSSADSCSE